MLMAIASFSSIRYGKIVVNRPQAALFVLLIFTMVLSAVWNEAFDLGMGAVIIAVSWLYLARVLPSKPYDSFPLLISVWVTFLSISVFNALYPLVFPYKGMFYNPNSLGGFYAAMSAGFCVCILYGVSERRSIFPHLLALGFCVVLTLVSNSRIAFASAVASVILMAIAMARVGAKKRSKGRARLYLIAILAVSLMGAGFFWQGIYDVFIQKFIIKASAGDISNSRFDIWEQILANITLLGNGRDAFATMDHAAHSTYFSILAQYGYLSALLFVLLIGWTIVLSTRKAVMKFYGGAPLIFAISFALLSITEGMLMKTSMFLLMLVLNLPTIKLTGNVEVENKSRRFQQAQRILQNV
ncbi:O-antigen ligase family protein [Aromatoleum bremense]|uniref:O-antigen ligase domain-containing protein n=1 Tax=Aromatoleum bremense TaxID=76115 RepID=A0ABX1NXI9_9RHOO|nr:O-antigen ligase family protein [Aromatoleum bremense]NMG16647.1 hypothetical protein [Aromatoleum bremense]